MSESNHGKLQAWQLQPEALKLSALNSVKTHGDSPCYIAISPNNQYLALANYVTGTVAVYRRDLTSGEILELITTDQLEGNGPNKQRQESPHAHWINWTPDGKRLYVVDLGSDTISYYEQKDQWQQRRTALKLSPGAGPRHMVFHQRLNTSYVLNELNNTVVTSTVKPNGRFEAIQQIATLPDDFHGKSQAGHISLSPDEKYLLASNRGHNSIVVFDIQPDGKLKHQQTISSGGDWPRFFLISPDKKWVLVANQFSHSINAFRFGETGRLSPTEVALPVPQPVFLELLE